MEPKPSSESGGFGKGVVYVVLEVVKTSRRGCGMLFAHHPGPMCVLIQFRVCVWTVSLFQDVRAGSVCVCCERERDGAGVCVCPMGAQVDQCVSLGTTISPGQTVLALVCVILSLGLVWTCPGSSRVSLSQPQPPLM